jgi:hypothetical protein
LVASNDYSSEDTDSDSSCEDKENDFMLMEKEDYDNKSIGSDDNNEEVLVDMEGELISALEEIDRLIIKNKKQKQLLIQFEKESKKPDENFFSAESGIRRGKENRRHTETTIVREESQV